MTASQSIVLGVVSGLISGYALYILAALFRRIILPWYRNTIYKGLSISGTWQLQSDDYQRRDITFQINQKADALRGLSTHVLREGQNDRLSERVRTYALDGTIHDRFVIITGRPIEASRIGAMTFLLEVLGDGTVMKGFGSGYSSSLMKIDSRPFAARRVKESQEAEQAPGHIRQ